MHLLGLPRSLGKLLRNRSAPNPPEKAQNDSNPLNWSGSIQPIDGHWFVKKANFWRDFLNPLQGLTIQKAVALMQQAEYGAYADLQWTYRLIEKRDPTLSALLSRYDGGLLKLDWSIKVKPEKLWPKGATQALADAQETALREAYDRLDNIREVLAKLILAEFRGFCHFEKHRDADGNIFHLEPVPQWYWCREGSQGEWTFNVNATSGMRQGSKIDIDDFIIYEVPRPINEIALINFVFCNLCKKDWAGFLEAFGIPATFFIAPPGIGQSPEKEKKFQEIVEKIIADFRGTLPNGADVKFGPSAEKGKAPFQEFMEFLRTEVVLAGTGGKLTMLTESGSGTLAGGAHQDAWYEIMQAKGKQHSEVMQRFFDKPEVLEKQFPGKPALAYWELSTNEAVDNGEIAKEVLTLSQAGYEVSAEQVSEKTGYELEKKEPLLLGPGQPGQPGQPPPNGKPSVNGKPPGANGKGQPFPQPPARGMKPANGKPENGKALRNREGKTLEETAAEQYAAALLSDFHALMERGKAILTEPDEAKAKAKAQALLVDLHAIKAELLKLPSTAKVIAETQFAALVNGIAEAAKDREAVQE